MFSLWKKSVNSETIKMKASSLHSTISILFTTTINLLGATEFSKKACSLVYPSGSKPLIKLSLSPSMISMANWHYEAPEIIFGTRSLCPGVSKKVITLLGRKRYFSLTSTVIPFSLSSSLSSKIQAKERPFYLLVLSSNIVNFLRIFLSTYFIETII